MPKSRLVLALIAVVLLLLGGGVTSYFLGFGPFASSQSGKKKAAPAKPHFVEMDPIAIPIIDGDRVLAHVILEIQLEAEGEHHLKVTQAKTQLTNAFLSDLYDFIPAHFKARGQQGTDYVLLKERIKIICDRLLGPGKVRGVMLQGGLDRVFTTPKTLNQNGSDGS